MNEWRFRIGCLAVGVVGGLFLGGFLWSKPTTQEQTTIERIVTVQSVREVQVVATVTVERTVIVRERIRADREVTTTTQAADGTTTIRYEMFGLNVSREMTESESWTLHSQESSSQHLTVAESTQIAQLMTRQPRWTMGVLLSREIGSDFLRMSLDMSDVNVLIGYRPFDAPFSVVGTVGVSRVGLGVVATF